MISRLCENTIEKRSPMVINHTMQGFVKYPARIWQTSSFVPKLPPPDKKNFIHTISAGKDIGLDERSLTIALNKPITINGKTILALRLKGINPIVGEDGQTIKPYTDGKGFRTIVISATDDGKIAGSRDYHPTEYAAAGTMSYDDVSTEAGVADLLGRERTDVLLGFGLYDGLKFNGRDVGFVIYGLERGKQDIRLWKHIADQIKSSGMVPDAGSLAMHTGKLLRDMHDFRNGRLSGILIHGCPHLGNYAIFSEDQARILDFETSHLLAGIDRKTIWISLLVDLLRPAFDYMTYVRYTEKYDDEYEDHDIYTTPLLPYFFWGYFRGDTKLPFVKNLERFINSKSNINGIEEMFGRLSSFECGRRWGGSFTLAEPFIELSARSEEALAKSNTVDPKKYRKESTLFDQLSRALEDIST